MFSGVRPATDACCANNWSEQMAIMGQYVHKPEAQQCQVECSVFLRDIARSVSVRMRAVQRQENISA